MILRMPCNKAFHFNIYRSTVDYITDVKTKVEYSVLEDFPRILSASNRTHLSKVCLAPFF